MKVTLWEIMDYLNYQLDADQQEVIWDTFYCANGNIIKSLNDYWLAQQDPFL